MGDEGSDAYTALAVALRHRVDEDGVLLNALQVHGADIGRASVDVLAVHLVGEEVEVVLLHQIAYLVHLPPGIEIARGVVGIADEDGAGALVDELLEALHPRQGKSLLDGGGDGAYGGAGRHGKGHVVGIGGLRDDDLVAGIESAHKRKEHRLGTSRGDDDVVGGHIDAVFGIVAHQLLAIAQIPLRGRILKYLTVNGLQCVERTLRSGKVGLAYVEMVHLGAPLLGGLCQRSQFPDGRLRHLQSAY